MAADTAPRQGGTWQRLTPGTKGAVVIGALVVVYLAYRKYAANQAAAAAAASTGTGTAGSATVPVPAGSYGAYGGYDNYGYGGTGPGLASILQELQQLQGAQSTPAASAAPAAATPNYSAEYLQGAGYALPAGTNNVTALNGTNYAVVPNPSVGSAILASGGQLYFQPSQGVFMPAPAPGTDPAWPTNVSTQLFSKAA